MINLLRLLLFSAVAATVVIVSLEWSGGVSTNNVGVFGLHQFYCS